MKNHMKRIAAPKSWFIDRSAHMYAVRPNPGAHTLEMGLALGTILRDVLHLAVTMGEIRKLLIAKEVLVDGVRRKDHQFMVGLFDVITVVDHKKHYRVILDDKGRLHIAEIPAAESAIKVSKVVGKTMLRGKKIQYHLFDGKNVTSDITISVGDSVLVALPSLQIKKVFPLKEGAHIFLTKGKHSGEVGQLKSLKGSQAVYQREKEEVETLREYVYVVGEKTAEMTIHAK